MGKSTVGNSTVGRFTVGKSTVGKSTVSRSTVGKSTTGKSTVGKFSSMIRLQPYTRVQDASGPLSLSLSLVQPRLIKSSVFLLVIFAHMIREST